MSIYIKGMEMPENCDECPIKAWEDEWYVCPFSGVTTLSIGCQDSCPLVEIPPHGRLIDAEAMEKSLVAQIEQCTRLLESLECVDNLREFESQREVLKEILEEINFALTVIPADKED